MRHFAANLISSATPCTGTSAAGASACTCTTPTTAALATTATGAESLTGSGDAGFEASYGDDAGSDARRHRTTCRRGASGSCRGSVRGTAGRDGRVSADGDRPPSGDAVMTPSKGRAKMEKVMREWQTGTLRSSNGQRVTSRQQALAIGLSEGRRAMRASTRPMRSAR